MVNEDNCKNVHKSNPKMVAYFNEHKRSLEQSENFWQEKSKIVEWFKDPDQIISGSLEAGNVKWFQGGKLNVCYNCVDRHLNINGDTTAIIWEGDGQEIQKVSYSELHLQVCRMANYLKRVGVRKGDVVCIYMPMIPEAAYAVLACARIGAPHNFVFGGFSPEALADRISECGCKVVITADKTFRGGKAIHLIDFTKEAVRGRINSVEKILAFHRTEGEPVPENEVDVLWLNAALEEEQSTCPAEEMDSEDPLFLLYTSGSTGKPKGLVHTTGGYIVYASYTHKTIFDIRPGDIFGCVADVGWITGHSYVIYGPLSNGVTTLMFESTPLFPTPSRYWQMVERHKLTQFYSSPTAIRCVQKFGDQYVKGFDLSSLRVLGTVGEPINEKAWQWYFSVVGGGKIPVVDTYWQTETGGIIVSPIPNVTPLKPGSATFPFFGIDPIIIDPISHKEVATGEKGVLCIKAPWPGMARTILGDHKLYKEKYLNKYEGIYYTGDGAYKDADGYMYITGRVDDVISISGHRIGTSDIEAAISKHKNIVECAVIGVHDDLRGQKWLAFVIRADENADAPVNEIKASVRDHVGPFASIGDVIFVKSLPKTRSGKIMRRLLRKIVCKETDCLGDVSTVTDPAVVGELMEAVQFHSNPLADCKPI